MRRNPANMTRRRITLDDTSRKLFDLGVTKDALLTTLKKESREDLRQVIQDELYIDEYGWTQWIVFSPASSKSPRQSIRNAGYCDLLFHLFMKEMYLAGHKSIKCLKVHDMHDMAVNNDRYETRYLGLPSGLAQDAEPVIFVPDFYPEVRSSDRYEALGVGETFEHYMLKRFYNDNIGFVLQSCVPLDKIDRWWTKAFLGVVMRNSISLQIEAPKE